MMPFTPSANASADWSADASANWSADLRVVVLGRLPHVDANATVEGFESVALTVMQRVVMVLDDGPWQTNPRVAIGLAVATPIALAVLCVLGCACRRLCALGKRGTLPDSAVDVDLDTDTEDDDDDNGLRNHEMRTPPDSCGEEDADPVPAPSAAAVDR